jgi:hypothetical protein
MGELESVRLACGAGESAAEFNSESSRSQGHLNFFQSLN